MSGGPQGRRGYMGGGVVGGAKGTNTRGDQEEVGGSEGRATAASGRLIFGFLFLFVFLQYSIMHVYYHLFNDLRQACFYSPQLLFHVSAQLVQSLQPLYLLL